MPCVTASMTVSKFQLLVRCGWLQQQRVAAQCCGYSYHHITLDNKWNFSGKRRWNGVESESGCRRWIRSCNTWGRSSRFGDKSDDGRCKGSNVLRTQTRQLEGFVLKPYLDFKHWKTDIDYHKQNIIDRNVIADVEAATQTYDSYLNQKQKIERFRHERNILNKKIGQEKDKTTESFKQLIEQSKQYKESVHQEEKLLGELETAMLSFGWDIPNSTHPDVPRSTNEEDATILKWVGEKKEFPFKPMSHVDMIELHNFANFKTGAMVTGSRFYFLHNKAALLELALVNYAMDFMSKRGYEPVIVPDLVKTSIAEACGFRPRDDSSQTYLLNEKHASGPDAMCLSGTAEVPLAGMWMNHTFLSEDDLPKKYVAFGKAFRCEAGGTGSVTRGLYRVHQFTKVELFSLCKGDLDVSNEIHASILQDEIDFFTSLGLHFKVLDMPTGDLGAPAYRKFDIEAWMPGRGSCGEISSASNCTDYQSRRLNIRYKDANEKTNMFVHTLNGTACAVPRMIVAIMETYQREDGDFDVPQVLLPFMAGSHK
eukprot:m.32097 g.32097  ORF g.32097 m.32097 type:complete len:539 (+) comp6361_c0_seq2:42-1658(+)